jgi:hypothetical protein
MINLKSPLPLLGLILILSFGCKKNNIAQSGPLEIKSPGSFGTCFGDYDRSKGYVIRNDSEYRQLREAIVINSISGCDTVSLPAIDFNKYTLLGYYLSRGCTLEVDRQVVNDVPNKKYIYSLKIHNTTTLCRSLVISMNWVLVPKLPGDYTVDFVVNNAN